MSTTDTRAKLAELFKRLADPATTDLEALDAFVWFRKMRLDAEDVGQALGVAPNGPPMTMPTQLAKPAASDGPMWPFKKKHAGESIAHIARTDPEYLRYAVRNFSLREPLLGNVEAALAKYAAYQPNPDDV